jgi:hypothetical protein
MNAQLASMVFKMAVLAYGELCSILVYEGADSIPLPISPAIPADQGVTAHILNSFQGRRQP